MNSLAMALGEWLRKRSTAQAARCSAIGFEKAVLLRQRRIQYAGACACYALSLFCAIIMNFATR